LTDITPEASPIIQQIGMLNLRINDMMTQLNAVMKTMMEENAALRKENADLKALPKGSADAKQEKTSKS
jgi:regulator of replication initiation timing